MVRIGDLMPATARALGLEDELRLSRAIATFEAIVAERVPAAAGSCRVIQLEGFALDESCASESAVTRPAYNARRLPAISERTLLIEPGSASIVQIWPSRPG